MNQGVVPGGGPYGLCFQVEALLVKGAEAGAKVDGWAALHVAACHGHANVARALLAKGANPREAVPPNGWTALHMAAQHGAAGVVQALVQQNRCVYGVSLVDLI